MVINQIHSIGDLIFLEPMYRHYWNKNKAKPIVPVRDHLMWVADYIKSARFVPMSKFELDYESMETDNPDYLPARFANQIIRGLSSADHSDFENMMMDKYALAGLDPQMWRDINIEFNAEKSLNLMVDLKLNPDDDFILVNNYSQAGNLNIKPITDLPVYEMRTIEKYTVIDWFFVMLFAKENHHVSTSTFYIFQALKNKFDLKSKIFIYPRPNEDGLRGISKLRTSFEFTKCE